MASIDDIFTTLKNILQAVNNLNQSIQSALPLVQSTSTSATAGSETLPANPAGFLNVTNPVTGDPIKVPYYNE